MAQYSRICLEIERTTLGPIGVSELNETIKRLHKDAIARVGVKPVREYSTGDGLYVFYRSVSAALLFCAHLHRKAHKYSETLPNRANGIHLRIGVSTGPICIERGGGKQAKFELAGALFAVAKRLESNAVTGQILICESTYAGLKDSERRLFPKATETVRGKRHDPLIKVWRCQVVPPAPWERSAT